MSADKPAIWHPFTQHGLGVPEIRIARAEGATLYTDDGRAILDAISSWWVNLHGHGHPHIARAIAEQAAKLDQVIFAGFTHEPAERLAAKLLALAPRGLEHVFFSDSGSTAVEVAIKMAVGCWHNRGRPRKRVIALEHAYHGDMFGAMAVGQRGLFNAAYEEMLFDVSYLPFPERGAEQRTIDALRPPAHVAARRFRGADRRAAGARRGRDAHVRAERARRDGGAVPPPRCVSHRR